MTSKSLASCSNRFNSARIRCFPLASPAADGPRDITSNTTQPRRWSQILTITRNSRPGRWNVKKNSTFAAVSQSEIRRGEVGIGGGKRFDFRRLFFVLLLWKSVFACLRRRREKVAFCLSALSCMICLFPPPLRYDFLNYYSVSFYSDIK